MDNSFELPITHNGKHYLFSASLIIYGYSYKIEVDVFNTIVNFEPDEERNYRALIDPVEIQKTAKIDTGLLQLIAEALHLLFNNEKNN